MTRREALDLLGDDEYEPSSYEEAAEIFTGLYGRRPDNEDGDQGSARSPRPAPPLPVSAPPPVAPPACDAAIFVGFFNPAWLAAQHANGQPYDSTCPLADSLDTYEVEWRELADKCTRGAGRDDMKDVFDTIPATYQDGMAGAKRFCAHNHINAYLGNKCFGWRDGQMTADADWTNLPGHE